MDLHFWRWIISLRSIAAVLLLFYASTTVSWRLLHPYDLQIFISFLRTVVHREKCNLTAISFFRNTPFRDYKPVLFRSSLAWVLIAKTIYTRAFSTPNLFGLGTLQFSLVRPSQHSHPGSTESIHTCPDGLLGTSDNGVDLRNPRKVIATRQIIAITSDP